ncbi:MAG: Gfo/Idh/MocA family oxidoreductase [Pseudomonadota bacterium]
MNQPIRWGILGTGVIAAKFANDMAYATSAALQAVASRDAAKAAEFAARHGAAQSYASHEELVADDDIDAVYIATPNALHRDHALLAIAAGRPVLCEKPFALNADEAREIADAARAAGVFCMEAMWTRFLPVIADVKRCVLAGEFGEPTLLRAAASFPATDDPASRNNDPAAGGGALLDLGVYGVSLAHALFGAPTDVHAHFVKGETGVDRQSVTTLSYEGRTASITASHAAELVNMLEVAGTRGRIVVEAPFFQAWRARIITFEPPTAPPSAPGPDGAPKRLLKRTGMWPLVRQAARAALGRNGRLISSSFQGDGYQFEMDEVAARLRAGATESEAMSLDETIAVMETLDRARAAAG